MPPPKRKSEIERKESLLARLKLSLARNNVKINEWLPPREDELGVCYDNESFLNLPVVSSGGGMGEIERAKNRVADFVVAENPETPISKLQKDSPAARSPNGNSSRPMQALSNRLRNENRKKYQNINDKESFNTNKADQEIKKSESSDSEEELKMENRAIRRLPMNRTPQQKFARPF